jgi:hypothetical protein
VIPKRTVYTHIGWREVDGVHVYLTSSGALGPTGPIPSIEVRPSSTLSRYSLPSPPAGDRLAAAVRASLRVLDAAPDRISLPLYAALFRSVVRPCDFSLHIAGETGCLKSALAAVYQAHFGKDFDGRSLPGSWCSTDNALAGLTHAAQSALFVVDDFVTGGSVVDQQKLHAKAERLIREAGNQTGRLRMRADTTLRPDKPPRGLILSTGEDIPRGHSLRARMPIIELAAGDVDCAILSECQGAARDGLLAEALAAFISWLAARRADVLKTWTADISRVRDLATGSGIHRRLPEIVAQLMRGAELFLAFAVERAGLAASEAEALRVRIWTSLGELSQAQTAQHQAAEPTRRFLEALGSALASGKAHLASPAGGPARPIPEAWGWREMEINRTDTEWRAMGDRIGWLDGESVYLNSGAAHAVAERMARDSGENLGVTPLVLRKRLAERGLLASTDSDHKTLTVRRTFEGIRRDVLHFRTSTFQASDDPATKNQQVTATIGEVGEVGEVFTVETDTRTAAPTDPYMLRVHVDLPPTCKNLPNLPNLPSSGDPDMDLGKT